MRLIYNDGKDPRNLDSFTWYKSLYAYSRPGLEGDAAAELGPDGNLVSAMISTAIVPRLCKIFEGKAFDPYSANAVMRVLDIARQVEASIAVEHAKFHVSRTWHYVLPLLMPIHVVVDALEVSSVIVPTSGR